MCSYITEVVKNVATTRYAGSILLVLSRTMCDGIAWVRNFFPVWHFFLFYPLEDVFTSYIIWRKSLCFVRIQKENLNQKNWAAIFILIMEIRILQWLWVL